MKRNFYIPPNTGLNLARIRDTARIAVTLESYEEAIIHYHSFEELCDDHKHEHFDRED